MSKRALIIYAVHCEPDYNDAKIEKVMGPTVLQISRKAPIGGYLHILVKYTMYLLHMK